MTYLTERSRTELLPYVGSPVICEGILKRISSKHCSILLENVIVVIDNKRITYDHLWVCMQDLRSINTLDVDKTITVVGVVSVYHRDYAKDNFACSINDAVVFDEVKPYRKPYNNELVWGLFKASILINHLVAISLGFSQLVAQVVKTYNRHGATNIVALRFQKARIKSIQKQLKVASPVIAAINDAGWLDVNCDYVFSICESYSFVSTNSVEKLREGNDLNCNLDALMNKFN